MRYGVCTRLKNVAHKAVIIRTLRPRSGGFTSVPGLCSSIFWREDPQIVVCLALLPTICHQGKTAKSAKFAMPGTENVLIWEAGFSKRKIQGKNPVTGKGLIERIEACGAYVSRAELHRCSTCSYGDGQFRSFGGSLQRLITTPVPGWDPRVSP